MKPPAAAAKLAENGQKSNEQCSYSLSLFVCVCVCAVKTADLFHIKLIFIDYRAVR